ncbi:hypothetical protein EES39_38605 [Streptomyces sp. ADI92-24]|nr:hypothetical protein EES39_38605 [Streptomyces sp. ADI92-24]
MLQSRVFSVVHMPYEPRIRTYGLADADQIKLSEMQATLELARSVMASAHNTWGEPLTPAPVAAAATTAFRPARHTLEEVPV